MESASATSRPAFRRASSTTRAKDGLAEQAVLAQDLAEVEPLVKPPENVLQRLFTELLAPGRLPGLQPVGELVQQPGDGVPEGEPSEVHAPDLGEHEGFPHAEDLLAAITEEEVDLEHGAPRTGTS